MTKELSPEAKAKVMASEMPDYITPKQQAFIKNYISNGGNGRQAAIAAGYAAKSAHVTACELLKLEKIKRRVERTGEEQIERLGLDADWITSRLMKLATDADSDSTKVRALELLGKVVGMYAPDKKQIDANISDATFLATIDDEEGDDYTVQ